MALLTATTSIITYNRKKTWLMNKYLAFSLQNFEDYLDITISSGAAMHL
jgi:hypothetical protein